MQKNKTMPGTYTEKIGEEVANILRNRSVKVFHDHGSEKTSIKREIKLTMINENKRKYWISHADIAIVDETNRKVLYLIEIEDQSTLSPKKLFGIICTYNLAKYAFVDNVPFQITKDTQFMICGTFYEKGESKSKLTQLKDEMNKKIKKSKIIELIVEKDIDDLEDVLKKLIKTNFLHYNA